VLLKAVPHLTITQRFLWRKRLIHLQLYLSAHSNRAYWLVLCSRYKFSYINDKMMSPRCIQDRVLSNLTTDDRHLIVNDGCIPVWICTWKLSLKWKSEILTTHLDESWTYHFQLWLHQVFKFEIFTMSGLTKIFRNVFCSNRAYWLVLCSRYKFSYIPKYHDGYYITPCWQFEIKAIYLDSPVHTW
jgi:hypothetical protein